MGIKRIASSSGDKIQDTRTGKLLGSVGNGKDKDMPTASLLQKGQVLTPGGRLRWKETLEQTHAPIASEAYGWSPLTVTAGSNKKLDWQCVKCETIWTTSPRARVEGRGGKYCPKCPRVAVGHESLSSAYPEVALEAYEWDPSLYSYGSGVSMPWKCLNCKHIWRTSINNRTSYDTGCPKCAGKNTENLAVSNPDIAAEASGWNPTKFTAGSNALLMWKCRSCDNQWEAVIRNRVEYPRRWGCSSCNQYAGQYMKVFGQNSRIADPGFSIAAKFPHLIEEMVDSSYANTLSYASKVEMLWHCSTCDTEWKASVKNRTMHDTGCPKCSETGFDLGAIGYLYFVEGERNGIPIIQYGITNNIDKRLAYHRRNRFESKDSVKFIKCESGSEVAQLESLIKKTLTLKGVPSIKADSEIEDKFGGYTESFRKELLPAQSLQELFMLLDLPVPMEISGKVSWISWEPKQSKVNIFDY